MESGQQSHACTLKKIMTVRMTITQDDNEDMPMRMIINEDDNEDDNHDDNKFVKTYRFSSPKPIKKT